MTVTVDLPARVPTPATDLTIADIEGLQAALDAKLGLNLLNSAAFFNKANADSGDVFDLTIGDSTGDALTEWVYAGKVAYYCAQFPAYTVKYRTFSLSTGWGSWSTVQTGTGANTIWVSNASVAGASPDSFIGPVELLMFPAGAVYDNIDISLGQNFSPITIDSVVEKFVAFVGRIRHIQPGAGIFLLLPNTELTSAATVEKTKNVVAGLTKVAAMLGCGLIDVYNAYLATGNDRRYYLDDLHPSIPEGRDLYTSTWVASHGNPGTRLQGAPAPWISPYGVVKPLLIDNCDFSDWPDGQTAPTGWTCTNCTPSKDSGKAGFGAYALKLTNAGAGAQITRSLTALSELQGRTINVAAEIWVPSGFDKSLTGRLWITSANGVTSVAPLSRAMSAGLGEGYWISQVLTITVQPDATSLNFGIYTGPTGTGDVGKYLWIRSITVSYGLLPAPVYDQTQPGALITAASGLSAAISLPLREAMNVDGSPASAGAGQMSVVMSGGPPPTAQYLKAASAQGNTKTDNVWWEFVVPPDYRSGQNLTLSVNAEIVLGSGVLGTTLMTVYAQEKTTAGVIGSNLIGSPTSVIGTTNLFTYSQDFSNAVYTNGNLTVTGGFTDPFGGSAAQKLEVATTAGTTIYQTKTVNGDHAAASIYVKKGSGTSDLNAFILHNESTATDVVWLTLNYDTGALTYVLGSGASVAEFVGGFWRVPLISAITTGDSMRLYFLAAGASQTAGKYAYAFGAQIQASNSVGPYAATTSAAASSGAAAAYNFTITGTDLVAGDVLVIGVQTAIQETGGSNPLYGRVNSVRVS